MKKIALFVIIILLSVSAIIIAQKPGDKHPHMNAAKKNLFEAKNQLFKAANDYKGHKVKAINLIEEAIKEIDLGIASDVK